jgi:hypothetical protein
MGEAKVGDEFVTHEFDEAIAIQQVIVDAESTLSTKHPVAAAKKVIMAALAEDREFLKQLKTLGKEHGATGKVEDVAGGLKELMETTLESATKEGADSEFYEAHAVLLNLKRKQQDSAGAMRKIASKERDTEARTKATAFERAQKAHSKELATSLADYAVQIAGGQTASAR